ncbi:MAG: aldo/keto reductase, partial [Succinivibrio sp.]|nr:aldo/keto reductase [Succinivibrio sp.]
MELTIKSTVNLNNDVKMPLLGLRAYKVKGEDAYNAVKWALEAGYRLIDTARIYCNEKAVG